MGNNAAFWELGHVDDQNLLCSTEKLLQSERCLLARLLAHLSEVEERRLHLKRALSSMFAYCLSLGMSEYEAGRRLSAAGVARRFPLVYELLDAGKLSLSVICKLKHYLTDENHREVLEGVSGLSFRAAETWLAERFARPDVPARIRKLPAPTRNVSGMGGDRKSAEAKLGRSEPTVPLPERSSTRQRDRGSLEPLSPERYRVEFTASKQLKDKLDRCRELMAHRNPGLDFAPIVERALDLLLEDLMKQRFAQTKKPRQTKSDARRSVKRRTSVTAAAKREVLSRDGLGCSFVDDKGRRCGSVAFLELDHRHPLGKGGDSSADNLRLLCRAHNRLAAELAYGKSHVDRSIARRWR